MKVEDESSCLSLYTCVLSLFILVVAIHSHRAISLYSTFEYIVVEPRMISIADLRGVCVRESRTAHIS